MSEGKNGNGRELEELTALARSLAGLAARARRHGWEGWTETDDHTMEEAIRELRSFRDALSEGIRGAFQIGREYAQKEEELARLNEEIAEAVEDLARRAWGDRST